MKKMRKKIIIVFLFLLIIGCYFSFNFIKEARKDRTWPFNSSIGLYLPQWVKFYAYKYTNPKEKKIITQYYKVKLDYINIPAKSSVGGGGAINQIKNDEFLLTLNNGDNFIFNLENKEFYKQYSSFEGYSGIRDILINNKKNQVFVLGIKKEKGDCKRIYLDQYKITNISKTFDFNNQNTIWRSEELCNNPVENNGGGRILEYQGSYLISTGFFAQNKNSGIYNYPQDLNSSFGKIIKIYKKNKKFSSEIYSYGHRNPQGLIFSKKNNIIISSEHGPQGGDEINIINKNGNYGWPCKTWGARYDYNFKINSEIWPKNLEDYGCNNNSTFIEPLFSWSPSIAVSQGIEYTGEEFSQFNNNLLFGSLKAASIFRLYLSNEMKVINYEKIFINERIRDIVLSKEGKIILYTDGGNLVILKRIKS